MLVPVCFQAGTSSHISPYALVFQSSTIISIAVSYLAHHSYFQWPIKASLWILPALLGTAQWFMGSFLSVPANCDANWRRRCSWSSGRANCHPDWVYHQGYSRSRVAAFARPAGVSIQGQVWCLSPQGAVHRYLSIAQWRGCIRSETFKILVTPRC